MSRRTFAQPNSHKIIAGRSGQGREPDHESTCFRPGRPGVHIPSRCVLTPPNGQRGEGKDMVPEPPSLKSGWTGTHLCYASRSSHRNSTQSRPYRRAGRGIAFLLRAQIVSGPEAGGMPGAIIISARDSSQIRIDYVQHALCAWLRYGQLFQPREATLETYNRP
jgi:hypothetical protein